MGRLLKATPGSHHITRGVEEKVRTLLAAAGRIFLCLASLERKRGAPATKPSDTVQEKLLAAQWTAFTWDLSEV